jgi:AcrR family transcriptional regulator
MARLTRQEARANTRGRLLEAAGACFARLGYGGASVDAIAEGAGYSKGALYSNFADKEAIFLELMRSHMASEQTAIEALMSGGEARGDILKGLESWLEGVSRHTDWPLLAVEMQLHANRNPVFASEYGTLNTAHRAALGQLVAGLFAKAGKRPPAAPELLAGALMALSVGLVLQRPVAGETQGADPMAAVVRLLIDSLLTAAEPIGSA